MFCFSLQRILCHRLCLLCLLMHVRLVNIGPEDIHNGNLKLILGLLWTIIYFYQVSKSFKEAAPVGAKKGTAKDLLLEVPFDGLLVFFSCSQWVRATIPEYNITNFNKDWNDGRAICALANAVGMCIFIGHCLI